MDWLTLALLFVAGASVATLLNAAVYGWAWNYRRVSPWQTDPEGVEPRVWADRLPIVGWIRLRRDEHVLGRGFWIRPLLVEVAFGAAIAALYWHECLELALVTGQSPRAYSALPSLYTSALCGFVLHAVLAGWMTIASLIDLDEKTIPDEVTVPGVLLGLVLATLLPAGLLPNLQERSSPPVVGTELIHQRKEAPITGREGGTLWIEPTHLAAPSRWPDALKNESAVGLATGLGCYWLWCFALTTRIWRTRRGWWFGLRVLMRRVARDLTTRPLSGILIGGTLAIVCVWHTGGGAWLGLLSSLVGMAVGGGVVWSVRLIGSAALGKEAMGFGDVTLMMMIGAFLGWQASLLIFFLAPFAALVIGLAQVLFKRDDVIPYGPFLCLAAAGVVVRWSELWTGIKPFCAQGLVLPAVLVVCLVLLGVMLAVWGALKARLFGVSED